MTKVTRDMSFKPSLSRAESKAEAVYKVAMSMIEQEVAQRDAKTARLREARLAKEAGDREVAKTAAPAAPRRVRRAK